MTPGGTVPKLRNFLYMHVGPKKAQNVILCTVFSLSSYKYAYFYSQWLKLQLQLQVQLLRMLQRVSMPKISIFLALFTDLEQKIKFFRIN